MALRRKMYCALIIALAVGGVVFHKTAMAIIERFPDVFGINSYVLALGAVYLVLTISMLEYFVLYRLRHIDERLEEAKSEDFDKMKKLFDAGQDDEIGRMASTINDVLGRFDTKKQQLQRSTEMYSSIVDDVPLLVCRFRPNGTITFVNKSYANAYEKSAEELIGKNVFDLITISGAQVNTIKRSLHALRPDRKTDTLFYDIPGMEETSSSWVMWFNRAFFNEHGKTIEFQMVGMDVYQKSADGLNSMMNDILNLVYFVNKDGLLKYASPTTESILGIKPADMVGKSIFDFIHDDSREFLEEQFDKRFEKKERETSIQELRIKNHKDQYTWVQAAVDSIVAANGNVSNIAINARDITDLKAAGENLATAFTNMQVILDRVSTLEFIIEKSPVITFVWKKGSSLDYISGNISLLGYSKDDFLTGELTFEDIIHPDDRAQVKKHIGTDINEYAELDTIKYRLLKKSGDQQFVIDRTIAVKNDDDSIAYYRGVELVNESISSKGEVSTTTSTGLHLTRK